MVLGFLVFPQKVQAPNFDLPDGSELIMVEKTALVGKQSEINTIISRVVRVITAYNAVEEQTDDTPCISASGLDICNTWKKVAASNEFSFGTKLLIDGDIYYVEDRTHPRYQYRIDLLMPSYEEAKNWGKQIKEVIVLK